MLRKINSKKFSFNEKSWFILVLEKLNDTLLINLQILRQTYSHKNNPFMQTMHYY